MAIATNLPVDIDTHPLYLKFSASHECLPHSISLEPLFMVCIKMDVLQNFVFIHCSDRATLDYYLFSG
jgi:hypothetical protein